MRPLHADRSRNYRINNIVKQQSTNMNRKYFNFRAKWRIGILAAMLGFGASASAQTWCAGTHQWGCYGTATQSYAGVGHVEVVQDGKSLFRKTSDGCNATVGGSTSAYFMNSGKPFDMTAGGTYTLRISQESGWGYAGFVGVWIDINRDGNFANTEYLSTGWGQFAAGAITDRVVTLTCNNVSTGTSRMRVRTEPFFYTLGAGNGCGQLNYGETEDFEINLGLPTSLSADFILPDPTTAWVRT
ncbi:MAG: GEVED domain-containing protein, partial [Bacteroidota bacterium]